MILAGVFILAYLIGSIPTAVWYGKTFHNIDVRQHGSGNAGATNTFRVLGKKAGSFVMAVDVIKGCTAASLPNFFAGDILVNNNLALTQILLGLSAVLGHVFPLFAQFKGGKGVASLLGMTIAIHPYAALGSLLVFLIVLFFFHYVSLGSMLAALVFPLIVRIPFLHSAEVQTLSIYGFCVFLLLVATHIKNIKRLLNGTESKIYLIKKA